MPADIIVPREPETHTDIKRVSWGAIFAGTVVAMALMVLFTTFGIAIGAAAIDPLYDNSPFSGIGVGSALYMIITQIIALIVGGFVAARLAGVPRVTASILHGAAVWSLATLLLAWAAIAGGAAIFNAASSVLSSTTRGAANVVQSVVPDDISFPNLPEIASQVSVEDLPPELQNTLEQNGLTVEQLQTEASEAIRAVVSQEERQRAIELLQSTLADALRSPGDIGADLNAALDSLVAGPQAILSEEDRQQALNQMQQRLGISPQEAEQTIAAVETRIETAIDELRASVNDLQQQALEAVQAASSAIATTALWLTIASLLGLAAAAVGAFLGKPDGFLGDRLDDHATWSR